MKLNLEQLENLKFHDVQNVRRQDFGRRIYQFEIQHQRYWLKLHLKDHYQDGEQSLRHELNIYQVLNQLQPNLLLPFQNISHADLGHLLCHAHNADLQQNQNKVPYTESQYIEQGIILADSAALFSLSPEQLNRETIIHILICSLDAVSCMHQAGFIHGDLKVEHFRTHSNRTCLIDFEQTCLIENAHLMKNTATPRYMAPELFHGQPKTVQSDIYALAIIWFEWLTQQKIRLKSYLDWAKWHCQTFNGDLVDKYGFLNNILSAMLEKNKVNRCANIYQIKQILSRNV
ncbi:protein kinase [Acinetobacter shaoyimingii]|uniref:Protein kinase n=1 Tax=Acinetobacter shaoyimingii TaxID=2715164 RepID=A0A6G8S018_9GAMM|nr:protein kinase [Acinetobacter shaoyimingii]QIO07497.1 protein kinase [Acinetobacter shaoyimingii]